MQALKDLETCRQIKELIAKEGKTKETIRAAGPWIMNMIVVKLDNGDIMLYSPVQVILYGVILGYMGWTGAGLLV